MKRKLAILALLLAAVSAPIFAQTKFPLTINCNEMGADVYINNKLYTKTVPNLKIQLPVAAYSIKIAKAGFNEFSATVSVTNKGAILNAVLTPLNAPPPAQVPAATPFLPQVVLNITATVNGADVYIDNQLVGKTPFGANVIRGTHTVVIRAAGYEDFTQRVQVNDPTQINASLRPLGAMLSISANIQGADVIINGNMAGRTPFSAQVPPGSYSVTVRAPGYLDFNQNVVVSGPTQVNAILQGMTYGFAVSANVQGAEVFVNGSPAGRTPYSAQVPGGTYNVTVRTPGYQDFNQSVAVNGPTQVNAILQPSFASWQVIVPEAVVNRDLKGGHWSQIQIYIDGMLQKSPNGALPAGRHVIRITSGGLAFESQVDLQPGRIYTLEPTFGFTVK